MVINSLHSWKNIPPPKPNSRRPEPSDLMMLLRFFKFIYLLDIVANTIDEPTSGLKKLVGSNIESLESLSNKKSRQCPTNTENKLQHREKHSSEP